MQRWILSHTFKRDINNDYGIYPENGDDVVMEAVDRNNEYEEQAAGGEDRAVGRQLSDNENEYDRMYDADYQASEGRFPTTRTSMIECMKPMIKQSEARSPTTSKTLT